MLTLEPVQVEGRDFLASSGEFSGVDHLLADIPGLGKTAQAITAADLVGAQDVLVVVPAIARVNWAREWAQWSLGRDVTIVQKLADCPQHPRGVLIVSANALSIDTKHGKRLRRILNGKMWDLLIVDECFPAGTMIRTPYGQQPIETLRPGDWVLNAAGAGQVRRVGVRNAESLVSVYTTLSEKITCTPDHPFLTQRGWVPAQQLRPDDELITHDQTMRVLQPAYRPQTEESAFLQSVLLSEVEVPGGLERTVDARTQGQDIGGIAQGSQVKPCVGRRVSATHDFGQPDDVARDPSKVKRHSQSYGPPPTRSRWKRLRRNRTAGYVAGVFNRARGRCRVRYTDPRKQRAKGPQCIQGRYRDTKPEVSDRGRREQPQPHCTKSPRSEKSALPRVTRVVGHPVPQQRGGVGPARCKVYNLEVSGHPSYVIAGGVVVHNCHYFKDIGSRRTRALYGNNALGRRCVVAKALRRWLLSGTPMPNDAGELWVMFRAIWPELIIGGHGDPMTYNDFILFYCQVKQNEMGSLVPIGIKRPEQFRALLDKVMLRRTHIEGLPPLIWPDEPYPVPCSTAELRKMEQHPEFADLKNVLAAVESTSQGLEGIEDDYLHMATLRRLTGRLKAQAAADYIEYVLQHDTKALILAVHREVIEVLEEKLAKFGPVSIHGGKTNRQQTDAIDRFREDPECRVAIGQIETVKTAINMQSATQVIMVEQQFTPSDNSQAVARAHRRGQKHPVTVTTLAVAGSFDEVIQRVLARKSKAINLILEQSP